MSTDSNQAKSGRLLPSARIFLLDLASFAGRKGMKAIVFVVFGALLEGLGLVLVVPLLGLVIGSGSVPGRLQKYAGVLFDLFGATTPFGRLALLMALFGVLMVLRAIVISIRNVTLAELQIGFVEAQRALVTERLAAARWDQVVRLRHARITHLMSGDIQRLGTAAHFLLQGLTAVAMLVAQCVLAFLLSPLLASLALALLVIGGAALIPVLRRARSLGGFVTNANLSLLNSTAQFLGGLKIAVSQNLQASFVAEFRETLRTLTRRQIQYLRQQTNGQLALTTLSAIVGAALVLVGFGVFHTAPPVLIALLLIVARMSGPAGQIQQGAQQLAHALPAYEKVKELEDELATIPHEPSVPSRAVALADGPIVFEDVSFSHSEDDAESGAPCGVRSLNLTIAPGEFIGIGGRSGAGKTTFADLLVGLFPPQSGRITVGGKILGGETLAQWRARISYVSQDPFLFHDTIRRNLSWASPQSTETDMWDALALVGADAFVRRMEHGLDTIVGERGTLVSGGERQRIALARAILRGPRLLVLDEATSAIDVPGEREIIERLLVFTPRPAIVMIAHRNESLVRCERVLRLDGGRLIDESRERP